MARFLIEVPHENNAKACEQAAQIFLSTGSHFLVHADWGCYDESGEGHKAWVIVELDNKDEARSILPPLFREKAKIITLNKFNIEDFENPQTHS